MIKLRAILKASKRANKMSEITGNTYHVIKFSFRKKWYKPETWFPIYETVSQNYIDSTNHTEPIYYTTK